MKARCVIISGSPEFTGTEITAEDFVIACDSGYKHAIEAGIIPDLLIGDFDSYHGEIDKGIPVIKAPVEKDDTDTLLAVKHALAMGFKKFVLLGAMGGRLDHQTANINTCAYIAEQGGFCEIFGKESHIYAIKNNQLHLTRQKNWSVSVFSFTEKSYGVTLTGLKYPLNNATLTHTISIGVSNEFKEDTATITVRDGILLIILSDLANEQQ